MQLSRLTVIAAAVVALSLAAPTFAQDRGGRGGRGFGGRGLGFGGRGIDKAVLLGSEQVRAELKIDEEQAKAVDEILASYRTASREIFQGGPGRDASDEERAKAREERTAKTAALGKETDKKLDAALKKEQIWRLNEIVLQQQGADGLVAEHVVASLELSEEQVGKIKASLEARDTKLRELMGSGRRGEGQDGGGFEEARQKMTALREETEKSVMAILSDKQKEGFAKLKGTPFELDRNALFRRGGQGGDGAGGDRPRRRPDGDGNSI